MKFLSIDEIVEDLIKKTAEYDDLDEFRQCKFEHLHKFHHGFGTHIRNEYGMWNKDHPDTATWCRDIREDNSPHIIGGVDYHPLHPDARSMEVIRQLWKRLNPET